MADQRGFFDLDERYAALSKVGDTLERLLALVDVEIFRAEADAALRRTDRARVVGRTSLATLAHEPVTPKRKDKGPSNPVVQADKKGELFCGHSKREPRNGLVTRDPARVGCDLDHGNAVAGGDGQIVCDRSPLITETRGPRLEVPNRPAVRSCAWRGRGASANGRIGHARLVGNRARDTLSGHNLADLAATTKCV